MVSILNLSLNLNLKHFLTANLGLAIVPPPSSGPARHLCVALNASHEHPLCDERHV